MKRWHGLAATAALTAIAVLALTSLSAQPETASGAPEVIPGRYIVLLKGNANPRAFANSEGRRLGFTADVIFETAVRGFAGNLPEAAVEALRRNPNVALVEPDQVVTISDQGLPTGIDRIDGDDNPTSDIDGVDGVLDVDIAVLDTGIDTSHPELNVVGGARFTGVFFFCANGTGSYDDDHGHGSHVGGIAAGRDNGQGIVGVAPGARLWAVKVLDSGGRGAVSCIIRGIDWVTANASTIEVANLSLSTGNSPSLCTAIDNSVAAGVVYAVAAGNAGVDAANTSPANCASAIAVSALADFDGQPGGLGSATCRSDVDDTLADFSNYGSVVDIAAPGVCIESAWMDGGYFTASGTSMATPHVAGAVALFHVATGYGSGADPGSVLGAMGSEGWTVPQYSECGFSNDPDGIPEPVLYIGSSCSSAPVPTSTAPAPPSATPTSTPTVTPVPSSTPTAGPPTSTSTPGPTATPFPTPVPGDELVPNGGFETLSYLTGAPPVNHDFESGNLAGWTVSGSVTVQNNGPFGAFASMSHGNTITSSPFDVPPNAQTLSVDAVYLGSTGCLTIYVLSGPTYATSTKMNSNCGSTGWFRRTINVTQWSGQSIRLKLESSLKVGVDNAGLMTVVLDQWDVSAGTGALPELVAGGPDGNFGRAPNAMAPISAAFEVPQGNVTLTYSRRVASGGLYNVYVLCGPGFVRCERIVTNDGESAGQWLTRQVDISNYAGQVIKLEFYNAGTFDLDAVDLLVP
jgi:subtilisin family serine protease